MNRCGFRMMVCFIAVLLTAGVVVGTVSAQGSVQISLAPLTVELAGERGSSLPFNVSIINNSGAQAARFQVQVAGLREGRDGEYSPVTPAEGPYAAADWVRLPEDNFEIAPRGSYELQGFVDIPRTAGTSGYAALVIELLPEERRDGVALSVAHIQRFVVPLEIIVGSRHSRSLHVDSMTVVPAATVPELQATYGDGAVMFMGTVVNDGDVHVAAQGTLIVRDGRGRRVREVPFGGGRGVIIPDAAVDFVSVLRGLGPGDYEMQAVIEYGGSRPAIGRMEFQLSDEAAGVSEIVAGRAVRIDAGPPTLLYEFPRGGYRAQTITVINQDSVDVDFTVSLEEFANDEGGEPIYVEPGVVMPYSAVEFGEIRPAAFTLRPGQRRNVVVGFRPPAGEQGGRYARVHIEGHTPAPEPGMEAATSEIIADALLILGTEFAAPMDVVDVDWRAVGDAGLLAAGATIANAGDIHGPAGLRLSLFQLTPETEEQVGDFVVVTAEEWDIVDAVDIPPRDVVLFPGEQRFLFGVFEEHALEPERQYEVLVEALDESGIRTASTTIDVWMDAAGVVHEGTLEQTMGDEER